jgi:hypothetical protein
MRRLLLTVCAVLAAATPAIAPAQTVDQSPAASTNPPLPPAPPAARLIKPRKGELRPTERPRPRLGPIDDRCKPLKLQLDGELTHSSNAHRAFQARVARNAGTRLCRDGQVEKGMAEFRKGLSYLEETHQP